MESGRKRYIWQMVNIGLLVLWMGVIFMFSSRTAIQSQRESSYITKRIVNMISISREVSWTMEEKIEITDSIDFYVRKAAHMSEYTLLGLLLMNVFTSFKIHLKSAGYYAFPLGIVYAISDEIHQYFVPGRACQVRDMAIDGIGVLIGIALFTACFKIGCKIISSKVK
ncbi:VanZ family protein [Lachnospiraceae bacterium 62-35]